MGLKEYLLNEIFRDGISIKVIRSDSDEFKTSFIVDNQKYYFDGMEYERGYWVVMFYHSETNFDMKNNSKSTTKILSNVFESIRMMILKRDVEFIGLSTMEPKLISLYDNIVKYFEREIRGFRFYKREGMGDSVKWIYKRVK